MILEWDTTLIISNSPYRSATSIRALDKDFHNIILSKNRGKEMKKMLYGLLFGSILLTGCSQSNTVDNTGKTNEKDSSAVVAESTTQSSSDPQEVTGGKLLEVGQWTKDTNDETGKVELMGISNAQTEIPLGEVKILITDIKILKYSDYTDPEMAGYYGADNHKDADGNFYGLQVSFKVKNDSDNDYGYNGLEYAILDNGQQIDFNSDDVGYSMTTTEFFKKTESKEFFRLSYLDPSKVNEITKVTIKTGPLYNSSDYSTVAESAEQTFNIK